MSLDTPASSKRRNTRQTFKKIRHFGDQFPSKRSCASGCLPMRLGAVLSKRPKAWHSPLLQQFGSLKEMGAKRSGIPTGGNVADMTRDERGLP